MADLALDVLLGIALTAIAVTAFGSLVFATVVLWPRRKS